MFDAQRNQAYLTELLDWAKKTKQAGWENGRELKEHEARILSNWQNEMNTLIEHIHIQLKKEASLSETALKTGTSKETFRPSSKKGEQAKSVEIMELEQRASSLYYMLMDLLSKKSATPFSQVFKKEEETKAVPAQGMESSSSGTPHMEQAVPKRSVPIGEQRLPPLPYAYDALEPYISEEIMRLHHDKHHQSYVDGLNKAEKMMAEARRTGNYDLLRHWEREAAFNGSGHYLHTIFWHNMKPNGGGRPSGELAHQINESFGSLDRFMRHFSEAADRVEGIGWAILVWAPRAQRLEILQADKHQNFAQWDVIPLLVLDVWEHAYYLQYRTDKRAYIQNWWNLVNWDYVEKRFNEAKELRWHPY
ncbi:superoxide dismutase [Bacillus horti]|uniref:superoxide dismutase n=1 Tax=Caldalkalibacillus horti TaxID=77523 RepID=A0ABT9W4L8_9BACI|nr:superoxide dismutase [Bacillus horti]MDQ0168183.1 Fe-Mn family superoxide dismutase [Bacillus horti]